jgi:hypothetical protein
MVAHAVLALSVVAALGLVLGSLGFRGIRLGAAGVMFAGLLLGQTGLHIDQKIPAETDGHVTLLDANEVLQIKHPASEISGPGARENP